MYPFRARSFRRGGWGSRGLLRGAVRPGCRWRRGRSVGRLDLRHLTKINILMYSSPEGPVRVLLWNVYRVRKPHIYVLFWHLLPEWGYLGVRLSVCLSTATLHAHCFRDSVRELQSVLRSAGPVAWCLDARNTDASKCQVQA